MVCMSFSMSMLYYALLFRRFFRDCHCWLLGVFLLRLMKFLLFQCQHVFSLGVRLRIIGVLLVFWAICFHFCFWDPSRWCVVLGCSGSKRLFVLHPLMLRLFSRGIGYFLSGVLTWDCWCTFCFCHGNFFRYDLSPSCCFHCNCVVIFAHDSSFTWFELAF